MALVDRLDERPINRMQIRVLVLMQLLLMIEGLDLQLLGLLTPVILQDWNVERARFRPGHGGGFGRPVAGRRNRRAAG